MYNEERKSAFLSEFSTSQDLKKNVSSIFNSIEFYELRFGIDFAQFDEDQLREAIPKVRNVRFASAKSTLSNLRAYVKWCKSHGMDTCDAIFSYEYDSFENMRSCYVRSPEHLSTVLHYVFPNVITNSIEYIYRSYMWLAYFGLSEEQAAEATVDDVDLDLMKISLKDGSSFDIYADAEGDIRMACQMDSFLEKRNAVRQVRRADGDEILRGKRSKKSVYESLTTTFRSSVAKAFASAEESLDREAYVDQDLLSINLSFKRVYLSGVFFRTYQDEGLGKPVRFDILLKEQYASSRYDVRHHAIQSYQKDYENWKQAFGL